MKKIDKLIVTSFIGPAILSYFVATFVLVMQFLWKYIDEILGKGLTILEMMELIFYHSVTLIPLAVPITVLISSVMVFGDMAEKYEISSMKSAGISLIRIMVPSLVIACGIGLFSLFASNFLKPAALLQFNKRFFAIRKQKSALAIEEGIFNHAFNETIIRVNKIDDDRRRIHDVLIYDHTANDKSLIGVMSSKHGEMYTADEGRYFVMKLDTGVQYREMEKKSNLGSDKREYPFFRTYFDQWTKTFDMSIFNADDGLLNFNRNKEDMLNGRQLLIGIDTFSKIILENTTKITAKNNLLFLIQQTDSLKTNQSSALTKESQKFVTTSKQAILEKADSSKQILIDSNRIQGMSGANLTKLNKFMVSKKLASTIKKRLPKRQDLAIDNTLDSIPKKNIQKEMIPSKDSLHYFAETIDAAYLKDVLSNAQNNLSRDRDDFSMSKNISYDNIRLREKYYLRLNQQFSWASICIIFLLIGAPLGSIIRKGGYGYPLLVAILFYMIFIICTIFGEKLVKNEAMGGILAAWLPNLILLPWALVLTYVALRDIKLNTAFISTFFHTLKSKSK